jgi:hypothetical protein
MIYMRKGNVTSDIRFTGRLQCGHAHRRGMLTSFARRASAMQAARGCRLGRHTRLERWVRVLVPKEYAGPNRRSRPASAARVDTADRRWSAEGCSPAGFGRRAGPEPVGARPAGVVRLRLVILIPRVPHTAPVLSRSGRPRREQT